MSLFDLSGVVAMLSTETITLNRYVAATLDSNGRAVTRTLASTASVVVSLQPITGDDMKRLPVGFDSTQVLSIWSPIAMLERDILVVPSKGTYEVQHVDAWATAGAYTKVLAKLLGPGEVQP